MPMKSSTRYQLLIHLMNISDRFFFSRLSEMNGTFNYQRQCSIREYLHLHQSAERLRRPCPIVIISTQNQMISTILIEVADYFGSTSLKTFAGVSPVEYNVFV